MQSDSIEAKKKRNLISFSIIRKKTIKYYQLRDFLTYCMSLGVSRLIALTIAMHSRHTKVNVLQRRGRLEVQVTLPYSPFSVEG